MLLCYLFAGALDDDGEDVDPSLGLSNNSGHQYQIHHHHHNHHHHHQQSPHTRLLGTSTTTAPRSTDHTDRLPPMPTTITSINNTVNDNRLGHVTSNNNNINSNKSSNNSTTTASSTISTSATSARGSPHFGGKSPGSPLPPASSGPVGHTHSNR